MDVQFIEAVVVSDNLLHKQTQGMQPQLCHPPYNKPVSCGKDMLKE